MWSTSEGDDIALTSSWATAAAGAPRGQCYVTIDLQRGQGTGDQTLGQVLHAAYPGSTGRTGYPQTPTYSPLTDRGTMRVITVGNPAAGADFSQVVPAGAQWIVRAVRSVLTTSAAVATRQASLRITDAVPNALLESAPAQTQAAAHTRRI